MNANAMQKTHKTVLFAQTKHTFIQCNKKYVLIPGHPVMSRSGCHVTRIGRIINGFTFIIRRDNEDILRIHIRVC